MELPEKIINIGFSILLTYYLLLFLTNQLKTISDIIFGIVAIIISYILLFSDNVLYKNISHKLFGAVYILGSTLLSKNPKILLINVIILITALTTRTYFDVCILYLKHDIEKYTS